SLPALHGIPAVVREAGNGVYRSRRLICAKPAVSRPSFQRRPADVVSAALNPTLGSAVMPDTRCGRALSRLELRWPTREAKLLESTRGRNAPTAGGSLGCRAPARAATATTPTLRTRSSSNTTLIGRLLRLSERAGSEP